MSAHTFVAVDANLDLDHTWVTSLDNPSHVDSINDRITVRCGSHLRLDGTFQDIVAFAEALSSYVTDEADRRDEERTQRDLAGDPELARLLARPVAFLNGAA